MIVLQYLFALLPFDMEVTDEPLFMARKAPSFVICDSSTSLNTWSTVAFLAPVNPVMLGPNITASIGNETLCVADNGNFYGGFTGSQGGVRIQGSTTWDQNLVQRLRVNAHNSNAIYTDDGRIIPLSLCLNYVIKA